MIAKVKLDLYFEVETGAQAEQVCGELGHLDAVLRDMSFPFGEPIHTDVQVWHRATQDEIAEYGLEEE